MCEHLRACIQRGAGLDPLPTRTPLNAIVGEKRLYDGYTVQNVALETIPGFWACGNLYRPLAPTGPVPAILNTHGHSGRNQERGGRFTAGVQQRCATLARMGAVALAMEMFAYGESLNQVPKEAHESTLAMTMQLWNNIRAVDFLETLSGVDRSEIAVTGESGGATQTFLLTALDGRICLNVPVVMVSSYFFGGCGCESGRPVHRSEGHFCTNAEIASLCAPRPMLVMSDGQDWTTERADDRVSVPAEGLCALRKARECRECSPGRRAAQLWTKQASGDVSLCRQAVRARRAAAVDSERSGSMSRK